MGGKMAQYVVIDEIVLPPLAPFEETLIFKPVFEPGTLVVGYVAKKILRYSGFYVGLFHTPGSPALTTVEG
jgi:hypothetical protein